jgi:hypothetical protein
LWDRLLPQAELTLNLLRTSRQHPQLSVTAHYHGMVDYNKTAIAPPGCKIVAHENQQKGALGHPMASTATLWAQQCITIDVKMSTFHPRLATG